MGTCKYYITLACVRLRDDGGGDGGGGGGGDGGGGGSVLVRSSRWWNIKTGLGSGMEEKGPELAKKKDKKSENEFTVWAINRRDVNGKTWKGGTVRNVGHWPGRISNVEVYYAETVKGLESWVSQSPGGPLKFILLSRKVVSNHWHHRSVTRVTPPSRMSVLEADLKRSSTSSKTCCTKRQNPWSFLAPGVCQYRTLHTLYRLISNYGGVWSQGVIELVPSVTKQI
ncbi:hypothetical protein M0802_006613 [Mischocyttarus mexicanus]|nr:hypothetical protein M0802_006613 [Mischocyttarus mexicanus]